MPKVEVLKPFIGSMDESNKYGHPMTRVIPHRRFSARWEPLGPNVIEVTEERAKELESLKIVKPYSVPSAEPTPADSGKAPAVNTSPAPAAKK